LRFCVDDVRPTIVESEYNRAPRGVYVRDVSEIRDGWEAFEFKKNNSPPSDGGRCLSIIGSERTIAMQFPSQFVRDWFFERLHLLHSEILGQESVVSLCRTRLPHISTAFNSCSYRLNRMTSKYQTNSIDNKINKGNTNFDGNKNKTNASDANTSAPEVDRSDININIYSPDVHSPLTSSKSGSPIMQSPGWNRYHIISDSIGELKNESVQDYEINYYRFISRLKTGITVVHHNEFGIRVESLIVYDEPSKSLKLNPRSWSILGFFNQLWGSQIPKSIALKDVSELRLGIQTLGFIRSGLQDDAQSQAKCLSLIGTQSVFDIEFNDLTSRNLFHDNIVEFILKFREQQGAVSDHSDLWV
jgi:hypothetical protein